MRDAAYGDATSGNSLCTPAVDADGTVFVGTGTIHGKLFAVNPDGTVKWCAFEDPVNGFWNNGKNPAVYIGQTTPIISGNYVYIGNRGSAGSMVAFDKYTGLRANFVTQAGNPTSGPAGGFQTDCVLDSRSGMLYLYCNTYGIGGVKMADFTYDNTATFMSWATVHKGNTKCAGASAIDADGNLIALVQANATTTVVCIDANGTILWETPLATAGLTDQGGIAIASDGTIYASMKMSGNFPGGVAALTKEGAVKWHYETSDNVSSAPVGRPQRQHSVRHRAGQPLHHRSRRPGDSGIGRHGSIARRFGSRMCRRLECDQSQDVELARNVGRRSDILRRDQHHRLHEIGYGSRKGRRNHRSRLRRLAYARPHSHPQLHTLIRQGFQYPI